MSNIQRPSYSSSSLISRTELRYLKLETKIRHEFNGRIIRHIFNKLYINVQLSMHEKPNFFMWKPYLICYANKFSVVKMVAFTCSSNYFNCGKELINEDTVGTLYRDETIMHNQHWHGTSFFVFVFKKNPLQSRFRLLQAMVLRHALTLTSYRDIYICK